MTLRNVLKIRSNQQVIPLREKAYSCNVLCSELSLNWAHISVFWSRLASATFLLSAGLNHSNKVRAVCAWLPSPW